MTDSGAPVNLTISRTRSRLSRSIPVPILYMPPDSPRLERQREGAAVIVDKYPVSLLQAVAVHRKGLGVERIGDEQRDQLPGNWFRP